MLSLCSSGWHQSIDYPFEYSLCNNTVTYSRYLSHIVASQGAHRWCIKVVYWHRTSLVSGEQDILYNSGW